METNEIFCKIFQKDITEEGYIYFPGREDALEQCTFEFQEDYTKRYESIARLVINNEIVTIMEGYSYYLYFKTSPEKKFKLISVDALLLDMIRIEGSDCFIRANYQTITSFATSFAPHFGKMCDDLENAYKRGEEGLQRQKAQELEAQIEKLEAQKKELNQKISTPSL